MRSFINKRSGFIFAAICLMPIIALTSGCQKPDPINGDVLDPTKIKEISTRQYFGSSNPEVVISPNDRYLLTTIAEESFEKEVALRIDEGEEAIELYSVAADWARNNLVQWYSVGWLTDSQPVFLVHGWQNQGPYLGKRGTAIFLGNLETESSDLIAFLEVAEQGNMVEDARLNPEGKLLLGVSNKFWECDISTGEINLIDDGFPTYHGISRVALSPNGKQIAYSVYDEGKSGIFLKDILSGEEIALLPTGETLSFFPMWSQDGKYIAAYTADQRPSDNPEGIAMYNFIPGEDGPMPAASRITVLDTKGNVVKTMSSEGMYLSNAAWLDDSTSMVYVSMLVEFGTWGELKASEYRGILIEDALTKDGPKKVCDLSSFENGAHKPITYCYPVGSLPGGQAALINIMGAEDSSIWLVSKENPAQKIADGWWQTARLNPKYGDSLVGVISNAEGNWTYLVGSEAVTEIGAPSSAFRSVSAYNSHLLVVLESDFLTRESTLTVYKMFKQAE